MDRAYEEAFAEIDEIFKIMPIDLLSKIPAQFRQMISENRARDYDVRIQEHIEEKNLKIEKIKKTKIAKTQQNWLFMKKKDFLEKSLNSLKTFL